MCIEANPNASSDTPNANRDRRKLSPGSSVRIAAAALTANAEAQAQTAATPIGSKPPRILVIWGDDTGIRNISHNSRGMMGFMTPNMTASRVRECASPTIAASKVAPQAARFSSAAI